jgi:phenylalanyl-tRNA synthetase beta chain
MGAQVKQVRHHVVCAVLRGIDFQSTESYKGFIDLQEKLHHTLCRRRTLASVGTHDLSKITPPFRYTALPPKDIRFVPLKRTQEVDGHGLMEVLEEDNHLNKFLHIIRDKPTYPVILDSTGAVLSLPPIINRYGG